MGQRANGRRKNKPGERLVCRMRTGKCVSFHLLSKIKQHSPLSLKRGFLIRNLHLFFPAAELLVLFHTLFFLPCLRKHSTWFLSIVSLSGNLPWQSETMKTYLGFFKQVIGGSIWGLICQVSWNISSGQAHDSNLGLRASDQLCGILTSISQRQACGIFRSSLCRLTPSGWVVPGKTAHLAYVDEATIWHGTKTFLLEIAVTRTKGLNICWTIVWRTTC